MGLFEINMPMIYGERENAFIRLQQQIIQKSKDESIFAWTMGEQIAASKTYSGLYAPSPSVYINCSNVVQTPGSMGFSENNGDLSLQLRILPNSPGTFRAVLHCAEAENRVFIVLTRLSNKHEYVRVRDPANISQGTIPESTDFLKRQEIRVPVSPNEAPIPIFFGFWLRTLQPVGYDQFRITILSNCESPERDYICQQHFNQGNTGIVCLEPKSSSDSSKLSPIRWIKFGFDEEYNPMLWLAGDYQFEEEVIETRESFKRAIASKSSKVRTEEHKEAMKQGLLREAPGVLVWYVETRRWKDTPMTLRVDRHRGVQELKIKGLGLKISVQLQSYPISSTWARQQPTDDGTPSQTMWGWVVDVTEVPLPKDLFIQDMCISLTCFPCIALGTAYRFSQSAWTGKVEQAVDLAKAEKPRNSERVVEEPEVATVS
jgi:hypothetical protein